MDVLKIQEANTRVIGKQICYREEFESTHLKSKQIVKKLSLIDNGTILLADRQSNGIGTHGRVWHTDEANNIAFSFFIKTNCNIQSLDGLTIKIANIIVDIFKNQYGINLNIKEPNDITFNNKKIGGILTQTKLVNEKVKYLVVGIGINTKKKKFTDDIKNIATSIKKEFGIDVDTKKFIIEFCNQFEKEIEMRGVIKK